VSQDAGTVAIESLDTQVNDLQLQKTGLDAATWAKSRGDAPGKRRRGAVVAGASGAGLHAIGIVVALAARSSSPSSEDRPVSSARVDTPAPHAPANDIPPPLDVPPTETTAPEPTASASSAPAKPAQAAQRAPAAPGAKPKPKPASSSKKSFDLGY
jgi:translation initiation factor IF-2